MTNEETLLIEEMRNRAAADPWGPEAFMLKLGIWAPDWRPDEEADK